MAKPPRRPPKSSALQFEHFDQHSLEGFDRLAAQAKQENIAPREALFLAQELLSHGHPETPRLSALLRQNPHRDVVEFGAQVDRCFDHLRQRFRIEEVDRKRVVRAYRKDGYLLFDRPGSRKLLVLFTTIFNNFFLSHLAMQAMLEELDCHLLILKETTLAHFQRGVSSFAGDLPGIARQIQMTARQLGADRIYLSGFSSSGFSALQVSLMLPCHGYLGFSHSTDLSAGSPLPRPWFLSDEVYAQLDPRWLQDLRPLLADADPSVLRVLCYGDRSGKDTVHARHVAGLGTIRLLRLAKARHNTILHLLGKDRLTAAFSRLVADR